MAGPDYFFCIGHESPWYPLPPQMELVATGAYQGEGRRNIRDSEPLEGCGGRNLNDYYELLTGTAGSLYIAELLRQRETQGKSIYICQYRKFLAPTPIGRPAINYHSMRVVERDVSAEYLREMIEGIDVKMMIPRPVFLNGYLNQYAQVHHLSDFLLFLRLTIECGILSEKDALDFINAKILIPGGAEFGVVPCDIYLKVMEAIRRVAAAFLAHHEPVNLIEPYQRRAFSFFAERLGSYLVVRLVGWPTFADEKLSGQRVELTGIPIGHMCTISDDDAYHMFGRD